MSGVLESGVRLFLVVHEGVTKLTAIFLSCEELVVLTGRKVKSKQIDTLRSMGLPFFVNACGRAVVSRAAIEGLPATRSSETWAPRVLKG
ncbi:DUF4224 domain-containing protein [Pandoraea fibrosis]|uniref:DUF4224 domain-containing protein n=1 Tax=Pandoraea fibrosis TaxID=1891094 RepID=A0ABX6HMZ8_9BURK|nr:DUF4224 domain-containing protein [Pandoraea fibrosis]QHE94258.1 DUF4224 domain-containing protein [Pandoraea fibrosis]QHF12178.1 DUF4224 domain-containing protein [Pandoraea fibrosis]